MEGIHDHWWIPTGVVISDCLHLKFFTSIMLRSWGLHKVQFLLVQPYKHSTWFTFVITSIYLSRKRYLKNILWIIQNLRGLFYIPYLMSNLLWKIARFIVGSYHLPKWCGRNKVEATFETIPVIGTLKEIKKRYFFFGRTSHQPYNGTAEWMSGCSERQLSVQQKANCWNNGAIQKRIFLCHKY